MPTYLDFNTTKSFRDFLISKTLNAPNGPQTFTAGNYVVQNLNNYANIDPGDVKTNWAVYFGQNFINLYIPPNNTIEEYTNTSLPNLALLNGGILSAGYVDSFLKIDGSLVSIMAGQNFDEDSRLMKFAVQNIRENKQGPVFARLQQNLESATLGRVRALDALGGNTATAINIVTGREPLVEKNYKITVAKSLLGKGVDFIQTVAGIESPFSEIPGDYLSDPKNPIINRPSPKTEAGAILQDVTGVLGSLVGIQRRPKLGRKPSDLMIEYMGEGQKQILFDQLTYSTYAPNYTTVARSQQSSKIFNFVNSVAGGIKNVLGLEAPKGVAYIGDDRSEELPRPEKIFEMYGGPAVSGNKKDPEKLIFNAKGNLVRFQTLQDAKDIVAAGPEAYFDKVYGGRMGNASNEGYKYRGRGFLQITGKSAYESFKKFSGIDVVSNPDLLNEPEIAAKAIPWFFLKYKSINRAKANEKARYENVTQSDLESIETTTTLVGPADKKKALERTTIANRTLSELSSENSDLRKEMNAATPGQQTTNNVNVVQPAASKPENRPAVDDSSPYSRKTKQ